MIDSFSQQAGQHCFIKTKLNFNFDLAFSHVISRQMQMEIRPRGYKTVLCSTQLSVKCFPLINVKMPTIVGILTFMSGTNSILGLSEHEKC